MQLRLASYNIHGCFGRDGRHEPQRVIAVVQELEADVIALQEVESVPDHETDFVARIAAATGMRVIIGPTLRKKQAQFGNLVLTRTAVRAVRRVDLSLLEREPRGALVLDLEIAECPIRVVATHLGLHPFERRFQIRRLLELVADEPREPVALLGDINEWFSWGRPLGWLHDHFGRPPSPASFPSGFPVFALDRIWFSPRERLKGVRTHRSTFSRVASDHLPVVAEVELERGA